MGSAFHQLCPRYDGTLTPTASTVIRLWEIFSLFIFMGAWCIYMAYSVRKRLQCRLSITCVDIQNIKRCLVLTFPSKKNMKCI